MYMFSEISLTGELPEESYNNLVLAHALCDWGAVMAGAVPPKKFGEGMVKVADLLGVSGTPDSLMELAKKMQ